MVKGQRKDRKGRILRKGESQLENGQYMYRYVDINGERKKVYSWKLVETDLAPAGKRAKESLREIEKRINNDLEKGIDTFKADNSTLNARWELYLETRRVGDTTREQYIYMWDKYVRNSFGKKKISKIKATDIMKFYISLHEEIGLSLSTIDKIHCNIFSVLKRCVRDGLLNNNPALDTFSDVKKSYSAKPQIATDDDLDDDDDFAEYGEYIEDDEDDDIDGERTVLSKEQEIAFMKFLNTDPRCENWINIFTVLLKSGLRISELCGLTKNDIFLDLGYFRIRRNLLYRKLKGKCRRFITPPKSKAGRRNIPIYCDELKNALIDEMNKHTDKGNVVDGRCDWVFRNRYNNTLTENNANDGLRRVLGYYNDTVEDDNLKIWDFTCHNFRHTFATKCQTKGLSERAIKSLLGHAPKNKNVTNRYIHPPFEYIQEQAEKLVEN